MNDNKTNIIDRKVADARVGNPCPTCGDHLVILVNRFTEDPETGAVKFGGQYGVCAGHADDTSHYELSPGGGKKGAKPRETAGCPIPASLRPQTADRPVTRVVKRDRITGEIITMNLKKTG